MVTTALIGRSADLSRLQAFCFGAEPGPASLLLRGEPGVGKTALLDAVAEWAEAQGFSVLRAQAVRVEVAADFSTLNQLLLPLAGWMAQLEPDRRQALAEALGFVEGSSGDSCAVAAAAHALLQLAANDHPLLLLVDGVEWADEPSAKALSLLARSLDRGRIRFLGTCRSVDAGFFDSESGSCTRVLPLDRAASSELVTRHFPGLDERDLRAVLSVSGGNPLALLELPRMVGDGGRDLVHGDPGTPLLSRRAKQAFTADIQSLPARTVRLLLLLALEGTGDLTAWDTPTGPADLHPAERAGLVSVDVESQRLTFSHPLVPLTVTGLATSDDCRTAHQELAQLLTRWPERRARHLAAATGGPDEGVAAELEAAAALLARGGDAEASLSIYLRSASLSENRTNRARRLVAAAQLSVSVMGDLSAGEHLLQEATRVDPAVVSSLTYARVLSIVALRGHGDGDTAHHALVHAIGVQLADDDVDRSPLVEATEELLEVCRWTQRPEHWTSLWALHVPVTSPAGVHGAGLEAVVADARQRDRGAAAIDALCRLAQDAFSTGDWERACLFADEGLAWCHRRGDQLRCWTLRWVKALVAAGRGDVPAVRHDTEEMMRWADQHQITRVRDYAHHARALAALGSGQFEQAYLEATAVATPEGVDTVGSRPPDRAGALDQALFVVEAALFVVEAALHTYRNDVAAGQAAGLRTDNVGATAARIAFLVAAATAMTASAPESVALFEDVLAQPTAAGCPFELARVHLAYGQQLRRSRSTSSARAHLRTALDIFRRLGASPWVERTRIELDATGQTRNQIEPTLALTPQERTIALLAAAGHTNKQIAQKLFLTHRTVAAHLHQVFPKLGVDSRAALRDALEVRAALGSSTGGWLPQNKSLSQRPITLGDDEFAHRARQNHIASLYP